MFIPLEKLLFSKIMFQFTSGLFVLIKKVLFMNKDSISEIRDRVNSNHFRTYHHQLKNKELDWDSLCVAMDVVSDMDEAFDAFKSETKNEQDISYGQKYLRFYGVMECLHVQQDAVAEICSILKLQPSTLPAITEVRKVRNHYLTHPYEQRNGENNITASIIRSSMTKNEFRVSKTIMTEGKEDKSYEEETINIKDLLKQQRKSLSNTFREMGRLMDEQEAQHRQKYSHEKLADIFEGIASYSCSKIAEDPTSSGLFNLKTVRPVAGLLKESLKKRGEFEYVNDYQYKFDLFENACDLLKGNLEMEGKIKGNFEMEGKNQKLIDILALSIHQEFGDLKKIALEVDKFYRSPEYKLKNHYVFVN